MNPIQRKRGGKKTDPEIGGGESSDETKPEPLTPQTKIALFVSVGFFLLLVIYFFYPSQQMDLSEGKILFISKLILNRKTIKNSSPNVNRSCG